MALKNQVVSGFFWTAGEKFASLAVTTCAWLVLMGLIEPDSFGIWGMIAAFSVIANSIVDSGFSQALIPRQNPTKEDFSSVFWCNTAISVFLYIVLTALSKQIASFYGHPVIAQLAPWVFLTFLLNALGIVQSTIFTKKMDFKPISKANFIASVTASAVALAMAFAGFGIWSLVANSLVIYGTRTLVLWLHSGRRLSVVFSAR